MNKIEKNFSKKTILHIIAVVWIIFSFVYIVRDIWSDFKNVQILQAYRQGESDTINLLVREAEKCEPVEVRSAEKQIYLIDINCLTWEEEE